MDEFLQFTKEFYDLTGVNLNLYKRPQMERRLTTLRNKNGFHDFHEYVMAVSMQPALLYELMDKMTINVSEFLRNPERWEMLLPLLQGTSFRPIRAWSAACSTGEEPYTLAMLIQERLGCAYQIVATDIDKGALQQARNGQYKEHQIKSLDDGYLKKYFVHETGSPTWSVSSDLKKFITYDSHNLLADKYPASFDLIICRNVMIYFTEEAKQHVIEGFSKSLKPGGLLFVGSTEQFLRTDQHGLVNVAPFMYRKKES
jgi:chemotaxis protein methyltransferase CheR